MAAATDRSFADVAEEALCEVPPMRADDVLAPLDIASKNGLPPQVDAAAAFGQPPLTLFRSRAFCIAALFWFESTTAIHDHAFEGAFKVVSGSSVHSVFEFEQRRHPPRSGVVVGSMRGQIAEILKPGATRKIVAGTGFVHSLFHLETPSVTLVARTYRSDIPQFEYFRPGLAVESFRDDPAEQRAVQAVVASLRMPNPELRVVKQSLGWLSTGAVFRLVRLAAAQAPRHLNNLLDAVDDHCEVSDVLRAALADVQRRAHLTDMRRAVDDPTQRLLLSLLVNVEDTSCVQQLLDDVFDDAADANKAIRALGSQLRERVLTPPVEFPVGGRRD